MQSQRAGGDGAQGAGFGAPAISLPKGGGAIRGIGEKFAANPATGTGSLSVPLATSPGRAGFGPQLALAYDSGAGNGPFGLGWTLSVPAIARKTDKGLPRYRDAEECDVFVLSGAEDLVPVLGRDGARAVPAIVDGYSIERYRPRIEGMFARIERWTRQVDGDVHWRSIARDNVLTLYGADHRSRIADPEDPRRIFSWLICESRDDRGNAIVYDYRAEDGAGIDLARLCERNRGGRDDRRRTANRYLKRVRYANRVPLLDAHGARPRLVGSEAREDAGWMMELVFDYGEHDADLPTPEVQGSWACRPDPFSSYRAGFEVRTSRLCRRTLMFHHFEHEADVGSRCLVRSTDLAYLHDEAAPDPGGPQISFLRAVTQTGYRRSPGGGYVKRSLPPIELEYSQPTVDDTVRDVDPANLANLPVGVDGTSYTWVDLHGEGIPGILAERDGAWLYKRNLSPLAEGSVQLGPTSTVVMRPNLVLAGSEARFMDLAGDGRPDIVVLDGPLPGFYEHDDGDGWEPFRPFAARLACNAKDANLRFVDLSGDGLADALVTQDDGFLWHPSLGEEGFGDGLLVAQPHDEELGPRLVFADGTNAVHLADLSGDGLPDLVRIENGEVCYWPNLGYGRFGARISMDGAPVFDRSDLFDVRRVKLADIDGTGTADLIYPHGAGVDLYFNRSGGSWSEPHRMRAVPRLDATTTLDSTDLFGNGTACLVWSSAQAADARRPMRYVDLMGGRKPHLLVGTVNNLGAETRITYASSTTFYLQDMRDGRPWATRLPFPVHVVTTVETRSHITGSRFSARFAYHHGSFDGHEREFHGFGMVEEWDSELIGVPDGEAGAPDGEDHVERLPPVHIKTWFHPGVRLDATRVSSCFAAEYYREPGAGAEARSLLLDDTVLPDGLTPEEQREACRALKQSILRQETYALDGSAESVHPYAVTERNFTVRLLQPAVDRHAVLLVHPHEVLTYNYERSPSDPRVQHTIVLEVDGHANVLKQAAIGYGRRRPDPSLPLATDREAQRRSRVTYSENTFTNAIDDSAHAGDHRVPAPSETRTYELTGYSPTGPAGRYRSADLVTADPRLGHRLAHVFDGEIDYHEAPTEGRQRRLIEQVRTLYRDDGLMRLLPLGRLEPLGLAGETCKLAFTSALLDAACAGKGQQLLGGDKPRALEGGGPDRGGYLSDRAAKAAGLFPDSDRGDRWWLTAGRAFLSPDADDDGARELAYARRHFFLAHRYRSPMHSAATPVESVVTYDDYDLLLVQTADALGNIVTAGERLADGRRDAAVPGNDYRVLQPRRVMDANRNRIEVAFDALGMVVGRAVMGKPEEQLGDSLRDFDADLPEVEILEQLAAPLADPHRVLGRATSRLIYDLLAYRRTRGEHRPQPAVVYMLARTTHDADLESTERTRVERSFSYSDGFGREIQQKVQAEPDRLADGANRPRWVGSGWTVFNNKDLPVRRFEPFFSATHRFELDVRHGVSSTLFYDPLDRVVATLYPDHTYDKVVFDAWRRTTWDVNDTVLRDPRSDPDVDGFMRGHFAALEPAGSAWRTWYEQRAQGALGAPARSAAAKAAAHDGTPTTVHLDTLGRPFLTVLDNGPHPAQPGSHHLLATRVELDIEGNQLAVRDAVEQHGKARVVMRYVYDLIGRRLRTSGMDAGTRWTLSDVLGNPIRTADSRGQRTRTEYDALRRPLRRFLVDAEAAEPDRELLVERLVYGEQHPEAEARNLRSRLHLHLDQAGALRVDAHDFKGNKSAASRAMSSEYRDIVDWSQVDAAIDDGNGTAVDVAALRAALAPLTGSEAYTGSTTYDALDRPVELTPPHRREQDATPIRVRYNEAGLVERVDARLRPARRGAPAGWTAFVTDVDYDSKGQRRLVAYGNGAVTAHDYDPLTFRLARTTTRLRSDVIQDLHYTYDPIGNLSHIADRAQQTIFFRNRQVDPSADYTYDAGYKLVEATGREHLGQVGGAPIPYAPGDGGRAGIDWSANDGNAMARYTERYLYDAIGNVLEMRHRGRDPASPGWTRRFAYEEASLVAGGPAEGAPASGDRLSATTLGGSASSASRYGYDAHGNTTRMPHLGGPSNAPNMHWDHGDRLRRIDLRGGDTAWYAYDGGGQRVRKAIERGGRIAEERLYLGGVEIFRRYGVDGGCFERETLHVTDDERLLALVETRTRDTAGKDRGPPRLVRFQLADHLGSIRLELDDKARILTYEEYTPYGSTSYQAVRRHTQTPKSYRYSGHERDEESGLSYHGARYYAPWLGRWASVDPKAMRATPASDAPVTASGGSGSPAQGEPGVADAPAVSEGALAQIAAYVYCRANPVVHMDPSGEAPVKVGSIYTLRATVDGQQKVYTGQTARELAQRLFKDKHKWSSLITAKSTTIEAHTISAELDIAASSRGTLASARKEALSAAEQVIINRRRAEIGVKELNSIEAAEEANILKWADRHAVRLGPRVTIRAGVKVGAFAGFALLDVFLMYRDQKMARYVMAPYLLEDDAGIFTLQREDPGIFRSMRYYKKYETGDLAGGNPVEISKDEFNELHEEAKLLWGTTDWAGDWVPGLLRRELEVVSDSA